jgi:hypothetical protein
METTRHLMVLITVAALVAVPIEAAEQAQSKLSNTRETSCLVKVTCDPAVFPLNLDTLESLLRSSSVGGKAARQVLDVSPGQIPDLFTIEYEQFVTSGADATPKSSTGNASKTGKPASEGMHEYEYAMMMEAEYGMDVGRYSPSVMRQSSSTSSGRRSRSSSSRTRTNSTYGTTGRNRVGRRGTSERVSSNDLYGAIATTPSAPGHEQTYLFSLNVQLPEEVKPAAKEFMNALVDNLRQALTDAYQVHRRELQTMLDFAESQRDHAQSQLAKVMEQAKATGPAPIVKQNPANVAVYEQLEETIDLPNLTPQTLFADVINMLKNSVSPPLQIQPNWKDLVDMAEIEQTTPAGMDPLHGVKVRKALEILLASVSSEFAQLNYVVDEGVILIATEETLPDKMETRVYEIPTLAYSAGAARELVDAIETTIEPESWHDALDVGKGTISVYLGKKLAILQTPEIHQKIQDFLRSMTMDSPVYTPPEVPTGMLADEKYDLLREKQDLEMEVARLEARPPVIEDQIRRIKDEIDEKVRGDQVSEELRKILDMQVKRLEGFKKLADDGDINGGIADAEEKIARAKIELARRREQVGASAGADQLAKLSSELATLTVDLAEKRAMLGVIKNQLGQTEQQLLAATISDPQVTRIRQATQIFDSADRRVNELNRRIVDLQPPTVSVIGGD